MAKEKLFQVGIKALIEDDAGRVLLLMAPGWAKNNTPPHWDIPGGRIQEGGTADVTLRREVEEETGVTNIEESVFFTSVISNHEIPVGDRKAGLVLMIYKVKIPADSAIKLSHEHTEYEWADKKQAAKRLAEKYPPEFTDLL